MLDAGVTRAAETAPQSFSREVRENLGAIAVRVRKHLSNAATGPLVAAGEIVKIADNWDAYKADADGATANQWLKKTFGEGCSETWFRDRAEAVEQLGEASQRVWHHDAARWATNRYRDVDQLQKLNVAVMEKTLANGRNPLSENAVRRLAKKLFGESGAMHTKACARCAKLEEALRAAGVEIPK